MQDLDKKILYKSEAADYLGISRRTLHNWLKGGHGPVFVKPPTGREYTTAQRCDAFLASSYLAKES